MTVESDSPDRRRPAARPAVGRPRADEVGIQRGREVVDRVSGAAPRAVFEVPIEVVPRPDHLDFRGPCVHGRPGDRFIYLSWGDVDDAGNFAMFRRAKLSLSRLPAAPARALAEHGRVELRLELTDGRGGPVCASIRPDSLRWVPAGP